MITGNESWIFEYHPETKRQSEEWQIAPRESSNDIEDQINADQKGNRPQRIVLPGQTVNQVFYKDIHEWLRKRVISLWSDITDKWMLHDDVTLPSSSRNFDLKRRLLLVPCNVMLRLMTIFF